MATSIIKKAAKAAVKELDDVRIDRRNMFRFPQKDQPLMEIPKGAPTVTEKTLEVAPEGVKGEKVVKSVIDTPVSRRTVVKSAGSQLAQNVVPKAAPTPQLTAQELFGSAKSMPDLYASMLPLVRKVAPEELASMADRLGFTIDDIIAMSGQDLLPRGDLTMEGLTRFEELFPITASRVVKKAGGGIIKKATKAITKLDEPVDPARRSFFRLPESTNLPAPVASPAPAPAVSGLGALEKAAQTPVSRRDVLKSAAGQAARAVMPSGLEALAAPVARSVVGQATKTAASQSPMSLQALVIQQMSKELEKASARDLEFDPDRVVRSVVKKSGAPREDVQRMTYNLSDVLGASEYIGDFDEKLLQTGYDFMRPSEVLKSAFDIDPVANPSPFAIKPLMRDMKEKLPDQFYDQFKSGVRRMAEDKNDAFAEIYARGDESIGGMIDDTRKKYLSGQISRAEMEQVLGRIQAGHHESAQPARPRSAKSAATEEAIRDAERRYLAYEINHNQLLKILGPGVQQKVFRPGEIVWLDLNEDFARHHGFFDEDSARVKDVASDVAKVTYSQGRGVPHIVVPSKDKDWGGYTVKPLIGGMSKEKDNTYRVREFLPTNTQPTMVDKELGRAVLRPDPYDEVEKAGGGIIKKAVQATKPAARERVYHAGAEFTTPNPGLFTNPDLPAVQQFKAAMGAPRLHEFEAAPKRIGSEQDVYNVARKLGIFRPNVPAGQYLEQGENAVFAEAPRVVAELRRAGFDSLRLNDGISSQPSLVALDPAILSRPVPEQKMLQGYYRGFSGDYDAQRAAREAGKVYVTPQRTMGDFYAEKRAAQTGQEPHLEMILADPFVGKAYGHAVPGTKGKPPMVTKARQLKPEDVKSTTRLYAEGGPVAGAQFNEMVSNAMKNGMGEAEALRQLLPLFR